MVEENDRKKVEETLLSVLRANWDGIERAQAKSADGKLTVALGLRFSKLPDDSIAFDVPLKYIDKKVSDSMGGVINSRQADLFPPGTKVTVYKGDRSATMAGGQA